MQPSPVRRRSVLLDMLVLSFILVLVGCGGGGGGGLDSTGTNTGAAAASSGTGTVTGAVIDASTGQALVAALVTAGGQTGATLNDGTFTITGVPAGTVQVVASRSGFGAKSAVVTLPANGTVTVNLVLGAATTTSSGGTNGTTTTGPVFASSNPSNNATGVDISTQIIFSLDQSVQRSTLVANNGVGTASVVLTRFTSPSVSDSGSCTVAAFSSLANTFSYTPGTLAPLSAGTRYGLTVTNRLVGSNGVPSPGSTFMFTTAGTASGSGGSSGSDTAQSPRLSFTSPAGGATNVDPRTRIVFAFDRPMRTSSLTGGLTPSIVFTRLSPPSANDVGGSVVVPSDLSVANVYEYLPGNLSSGGLTSATTYSLFVTNRVVSSAGVPSTGESYSFTVKALAASVPPVGPKLASSNPSPGATGVDISSQILFTFDRDMFTSTETHAVVLGSTVNDSTITLSRITAPSDIDRKITLLPSPAVTVRLFSGPEAQAALPQEVRFPAGGVDVVIPGDILGNEVPLVFRPDPVGFPRTFRYLPGTLQIQAGLTDYRLLVTNGVRDVLNAVADTQSVTFTSRLATVGPAGGPRLVASSPGTNSFTGLQPRILLQFDQAVDPKSFEGARGPQAVSVRRISIPAGDPGAECSIRATCDLRPGALNGDAVTCTCISENLTAVVTSVPNFPTLIEVIPTGPLASNPPSGVATFVADATILVQVTNQIWSLPDTTGPTRTAPGDSTWFYVR